MLPCLNEARSVGLCVHEALEALAEMGTSGEVIVVDNNSTDDSAEVARGAGAVVVSEPRPGYGRAIRTGVDAACGDIVVMADADLTYDLSRLSELVRPVVTGQADLVIGSRCGANRRTMPASHRLLGTPFLTFLIRRAAGTDALVDDSQSGFRAFRRDSFLDLHLRSTGMELASEMLIQATRRDLRLVEVPTGYRRRMGTSKLAAYADGRRHVRQIALLAPDLFLVGPGAMLLLVGLAVAAWSLVANNEIALGSLRWQPVFFATIAIVVGSQALLCGLVLAARSPVTSPRARRRLAFARSPRFAKRCRRGGAAAALAGLAIDILLVPLRATTAVPYGRAIALAGVGQAFLIVGCTFAGFGLLYDVLRDGAGDGSS